MSTALPETWGDVSGVATHRAASLSEPYVETASRSSCSWYAAERQPLSTTNSTPSRVASVAARRSAVRRDGSSLATPGTPSSKTVVPAGTRPSASPSAPGCSRRRTPGARAGAEDAAGSPSARRRRSPRASVGDVVAAPVGDAAPAVAAIRAPSMEYACNWWPSVATIPAMTRRPPARWTHDGLAARARLRSAMAQVKAARCCQHVCGF